MSRLPFNPENIPKREAGAPARREQQRYGRFDQSEPRSVTQVAQLVKRILADRAPNPVRVVGEVSNLSDRKHWFLSLKDEKTVLNAVMWASNARKCRFTPERGQQVVATGRLDYYGPQGKLQLYIDTLEPVGQGALELELRKLCEELRKAGYFDESTKKPLPLFPQHIAVVTSARGAALQDVVRTARGRWPGVRISVVDVLVQGAEAAPQVARAVEALGRAADRRGIEAIVLTRGGGSLEDLWAFNERVVADAVHHCPVPTAAAIGHETDTTVAELVADLRCSTPTQAAAKLIPDAEAERERVLQLAGRLGTALRRHCRHERARLDALAAHPLFRRPEQTVHRYRERLEHLRHRLAASMRQAVSQRRHELSEQKARLDRLEPRSRLQLARHRLDSLRRQLAETARARTTRQRERLEGMERQLRALGPENVLARGYSYTTGDDGSLIRSVEQVRGGDGLVTHLADGTVRSHVDEQPSQAGQDNRRREDEGRVEGAAKRDGKPASSARGKRKRVGRRDAAAGPGLFEQ